MHKSNSCQDVFFNLLIYWIFPHTLAFFAPLQSRVNKKSRPRKTAPESIRPRTTHIKGPSKYVSNISSAVNTLRVLHIKTLPLCACLLVHQQGDFPSLREVYRSFTLSAYETRADKPGCSDCASTAASIPKLNTSDPTKSGGFSKDVILQFVSI